MNNWNNINLELLKTFQTIAEQGSISKASESLFTTQPAVSRSIRRLELQIGCPLFVRTARGVALTKEGEILLKYAKQIFLALSTAEKEIKSVQQLLDGEIRIGISAALCKHYLMPYMNQFNTYYPGIVIRVTNPTTPEIIDLMKKEQIDIGIVNLPGPDNDLMTLELLELEDCFVAGEKYRELAKRTHVPLAQLNDYPLLMLEKKSNTRRHVDCFFKELGIELEPEVELGNLDLMTQFAIEGRGIACLIKNFVRDELESEKLYEIKIEESMPRRMISASYLKYAPLSPASSKFLELLMRTDIV
ncbi:LysR family transcriptional regulator [Paenibacillus hodogayensis]|uniref:LysR family transcriptional regulator n=1 Tax=Paenibacillus hodogayensis TaxID=279208 RepID=A0ABV5VQZ0_9BACL